MMSDSAMGCYGDSGDHMPPDGPQTQTLYQHFLLIVDAHIFINLLYDLTVSRHTQSTSHELARILAVLAASITRKARRWRLSEEP